MANQVAKIKLTNQLAKNHLTALEKNHLALTLDRIFDDATVFTLRGESFRGKNLERVSLQTSRVKESSETPES